jgi:hypothetical protein
LPEGDRYPNIAPTSPTNSSRKCIMSSSISTTKNNDALNQDETGTVIDTSPKIQKSSEMKDNDDDQDKKTNIWLMCHPLW